MTYVYAGSVLQQVRPLKCLALDKFGTWVELRVLNIEAEMWKVHPEHQRCKRFCKREKIDKNERIIEPKTVLSQQIKTLQIYLDRHMPKAGILHDTLVSKGIQVLSEHFEKKPKRKRTCITCESLWMGTQIAIRKEATVHTIDTILTKEITSLKVTRQHFTIFGASLVSKSHNFTNLTRLTLALSPPERGSDEATKVSETEITKLLQQIHNLTYFSYNSYFTDDILRCITENCRLIEELDMSYSGLRINDSSIDILTQLPNLKSVHLCGTSVGREGIHTLLLSCKNIEFIDIGGGMSYILQNLASSEKYSGEQFKLKTLTSSARLKTLLLVTQMCPSIESMTLSKIQNSKSNLLALIGLQKLCKLELVDYNFDDDYVKEILHVRGCGLLHLHFKGVVNINLMYVSQMCPLLQSLSIHKCTFTEHIYDSVAKLKVPPFRNVKILSLNNVPLFLITNCLKVEVIHMDRLACVTEDLLLQILDKNPLTCLRELILWQCCDKPRALSPSVIDRIIRNCINGPQITEVPI